MNYEDHVIESIEKSDLIVFLTAAKALLKYVSSPGKKRDGDILYKNPRNQFGFEFDVEYGICRVMSDMVSHVDMDNSVDTDDVLRYCFERWEHFTGRFSYPIPSTSDVSHSDPEVVYDRCNHWQGEQLEMREHLLNFIIKTITPFADKA